MSNWVWLCHSVSSSKNVGGSWDHYGWLLKHVEDKDICSIPCPMVNMCHGQVMYQNMELVGGLEHEFLTFHILGIIIPTDSFFFGGVGIAPTSCGHPSHNGNPHGHILWIDGHPAIWTVGWSQPVMRQPRGWKLVGVSSHQPTGWFILESQNGPRF